MPARGLFGRLRPTRHRERVRDAAERRWDGGGVDLLRPPGGAHAFLEPEREAPELSAPREDWRDWPAGRPRPGPTSASLSGAASRPTLRSFGGGGGGGVHPKLASGPEGTGNPSPQQT